MITLATVRRALAAHRPTAADEPGSQLAAVALVLAPAGPLPDLEALFIRRAVRADDPWSGQVGLPGGRASPGDADLLAAAIRETREEVAVDLGAPPAERLGVLDDIYPRTPALPPVVVRPFVFALPARPRVTPGVEVDSAFWVSLGALLDPAARRDVTLDVRGVSRTFPAYVLGRDVIWGMTERILTSLVTAVSAQR